MCLYNFGMNECANVNLIFLSLYVLYKVSRILKYSIAISLIYAKISSTQQNDNCFEVSLRNVMSVESNFLEG